MAKSHSEKVLINAGAGFALKLVGQLMNFALKTVFIYTLGMQYTGVSTLFADILHVLSLMELGVGSAITYALYKPIKDGDTERIAALMNFYKTAYRLIAAFVLVAGACCVPFLPSLVKNVPDIVEPIQLIFMFYVVENAASYLLVYKSTLLSASERRYVISKVGILFSVLRAVVQTILLLIFKNFIVYLAVGVVESLTRNFVISRKATHYFPALSQHTDKHLTRQETKRLLADVGALSLYKICNTILNSTDSIVISAAPALGVVMVGFLGNYRLLVNTVDSIISQFYYSLTPSMGTVAAAVDGDRQYEIYNTMNFTTFWCACFCCTCLIALAKPFVTTIWLTPKYVLSYDILIILVVNLYIGTMVRPNTSLRNANGLFVQGYYRPLVMAVANIGLDIALVRPMGVAGVLLATSISRAGTQLWYDPWLVYKNVFKRPFSGYLKKLALYTASTAVIAAITWGLCELVGSFGGIYVSFALKLLICLAAPNGLIVLLYGRTPEFKDFLKRLKGLGRRLARLGKGKKKHG